MKRGNVRKFGRVRSKRKALHKALATALIEHGKIKTTAAKGKAVASYVEKLVTKSKNADVAVRRELSTGLGTKAVSTLTKNIAPLFADVKSGYTRITRLGRRTSDGSAMVMVEFTKSWK